MVVGSSFSFLAKSLVKNSNGFALGCGNPSMMLRASASGGFGA
jgi:hypothetical protein